MNKEEIYQLMDIEKGEDFKYFESLADLLETDDNYDADTLFEVLNDIDTDILSEHASSYFEQMQEHIPDDEAELYTLIENIKKENTVLFIVVLIYLNFFMIAVMMKGKIY